MVTRSIVGRFLILAILIVAVGVAAQAALILTDGGKKVVKTASAAPVSMPKSAEPETQAGDPVRVVYPGPLGETTASGPKLADSAASSPLAAPAPQTTAKLAQAMSAPAAAAAQPTIPSPATAQPAIPVPAAAPPPAPALQPAAAAVASVDPDPAPAPAPAPATLPAPAQTTAAVHAAPATTAPAGVEVASLGGGAPQADSPKSGGVNINTATVESLNRLGGGHIGESIAKHRPYQSVEDLVRKRVLRRSVYNQIKNQLAAK